MKALRSPWVTGALVLVAFGVVFFQVIKPQLDRRRPSRPSTSAKAVAPKPPTAQPKGTKKAAGTPVRQQLAVARQRTVLDDNTTASMPIDRRMAQEKFLRWVEAPARDPFLLVSAHTMDDGSPGPSSPIAQWRLAGVWSQTGSRIAAINSGVYGEGEYVQGYKLQRIEDDQVWIVVSNRLERLGIIYGGSTNAPKRTARAKR